ncbi:hypothetical protein FHS57_005805 [Runella defluvii]|uniref:Uncharacterized protein n=1 Tax=Runella defluvii TaxID=370973 RepID=A0A7W5ZRW8_9BACT|nr:hypothetical protein [Runella defluvii]MBB3841776.1 hypothetical protein [Runella defluvii]
MIFFIPQMFCVTQIKIQRGLAQISSLAELITQNLRVSAVLESA